MTENEYFSFKVYADGIAIIQLYKKLAREEVVNFRQKAVTYVESNDIKHAILDLTNLNWIDSAGIGVLMVLFKILDRKKGKIIFVNPSTQIFEIFTILKLDKVFDIVNSVDEAINILN